MPLNERKLKILEAIITDYIATAEPVGSRTIAKKYHLGLSSATIRNEMSDLEEMGFIIQPHTSAGRIPSDAGYRLYVDSLMQKEELEEGERNFLQNVAAENVNQIEYLMEQTAKILSSMTNYTAIVSDPIVHSRTIQKIRFMALENNDLLILVATDGNVVKTHQMHLDALPEDGELFRLSCTINDYLSGQSMEALDERAIHSLRAALPGWGQLINAVIKSIEKTAQDLSPQFHLMGAKNILTFPEFSDVEKAKRLIQTLEEKDVMKNIIVSPEQAGEDVQVYIGNELGIEEMKDCSIITTHYQLSEHVTGTIGIVGPTRMNYSQVIAVLNGMVKNMEAAIDHLRQKNQPLRRQLTVQKDHQKEE